MNKATAKAGLSLMALGLFSACANNGGYRTTRSSALPDYEMSDREYKQAKRRNVQFCAGGLKEFTVSERFGSRVYHQIWCVSELPSAREIFGPQPNSIGFTV